MFPGRSLTFVLTVYIWCKIESVQALIVTDEKTILKAAEQAADMFPKNGNHLHFAMAIPGILYPEKSPAQINADHALETFRINVVAPMLLIKHFSPFLPRKATNLSGASDRQHSDTLETYKGLPQEKAIFGLMSARVGSITDNRGGGWYSYRASKAGVTQLAKTFDIHLKATAGDKALSVALHPGTVRTDFTEGLREAYEKAGKVISPEESAEKLIKLLNNMLLSQRGKFWDWKGEEIPY
jgi:NAD(P)-dependent dehydrogenase (short-subunit alcohol dehydrogenase family)